MAEDLWEFSLRVYARPGVRAACLTLQDEAGVDVNLLLLAAWLGSAGRVLDDATAGLLRSRAAAWQEPVVRPLRAVRRHLKPLATDEPAIAALRVQLAAVELAAECQEQRMLEQLARPCVADGATSDAGRANLAKLLADRQIHAGLLDEFLARCL